MKNKKVFTIVILLLLFIVSFLFRFKGLLDNHPFWVDEFSSSHQAQYILKYGTQVLSSFDQPPLYFENRNITTHFLIAFAFMLFGQHEWVARLPMVLIGSFIPIILYLLTKRLFDARTAFVASILTTFSYFEITWSRQARGYAIQQFLTLLMLYLYIRLRERKRKDWHDYVLFGLVAFLGLITHPLFIVLLGAIALHYVVSTKKWKLLLAIMLLGGGMIVIFNHGINNNLWYYHSFLWREYGLVTFLAVSGLYLGLIAKKKWLSLFGIFMGLHLCAITFLLGPYTSRYLNPIFPLLLMMMGYAIVRVSDMSLKQAKVKALALYAIMPFVVTGFIVANGNMFVTKPKSFYSVNHDFRDIALVDYHQIYELMKSKGEFEKGQTAVVETWLDRMHWYMGQDFMQAYEFKWKNGGMINGLPTQSPHLIDSKGEKTTLRYKDIGFINELADLRRAMTKYPKGFILIDDASLPKDVVDFAEKNLRKELYLDHYSLDDNPYSIWPTTLYSWGFN